MRDYYLYNPQIRGFSFVRFPSLLMQIFLLRAKLNICSPQPEEAPCFGDKKTAKYGACQTQFIS